MLRAANAPACLSPRNNVPIRSGYDSDMGQHVFHPMGIGVVGQNAPSGRQTYGLSGVAVAQPGTDHSGNLIKLLETRDLLIGEELGTKTALIHQLKRSTCGQFEGAWIYEIRLWVQPFAVTGMDI